jgi:hypothetical protein
VGVVINSDTNKVGREVIVFSKVSVSGHLKGFLVDPSTGQERCFSDMPNQITYLHLDALVGLITQTPIITDPTELAIYAMEIEGGVIAIAAAAPGDTTNDASTTVVKTHIFDKAADISFPGALQGVVRFQATIDPAEANGITLRAAGMYTQGDGMGGPKLLVCREVVTPQVKPAGFGVRFEWTLQYAIT